MRMKAKRITYFIICLILVLLFALLIIKAFGKISDSVEVIDRNNVNTKIVIDPGHGGEDGGAISESGVLEKDINLSISNNTSELFYLLGFDVTQTRSTDEALSTEGKSVRQRKVADMKKRLSIFNSSDENTIISIHQNKFTESKYSGTQIFYSPNNDRSKILAEKIKISVKKLLQKDNERECKKSDSGIYLLKNTKNPAVIVECGFISNSDECAKLLDSTYQKQMAFSIVSGFLDYYNNTVCGSDNNGIKS